MTSNKKCGKSTENMPEIFGACSEVVFEGNITEARLQALKSELKKVLDVQQDSVIIYHLDSVKYTRKEQIGVIQSNSNMI